jgi:hypothetical protein
MLHMTHQHGSEKDHYTIVSIISSRSSSNPCCALSRVCCISYASIPQELILAVTVANWADLAAMLRVFLALDPSLLAISSNPENAKLA